jgi:hypothetical protein
MSAIAASRRPQFGDQRNGPAPTASALRTQASVGQISQVVRDDLPQRCIAPLPEKFDSESL